VSASKTARTIDTALLTRTLAEYTQEEQASGWALLMARECELDQARCNAKTPVELNAVIAEQRALAGELAAWRKAGAA